MNTWLLLDICFLFNVFSDTSVASTDVCQRVYGHVTRHVEQGHCDRGITLCSVFYQHHHYPASSGFSRLDATLRRERNPCEQPFAFPSSTRVQVTPTPFRPPQVRHVFGRRLDRNRKPRLKSLWHPG